jgi:hypothetical protein
MACRWHASHPTPIREAIERHGQGLDEHPSDYFHENAHVLKPLFARRFGISRGKTGRLRPRRDRSETPWPGLPSIPDLSAVGGTRHFADRSATSKLSELASLRTSLKRRSAREHCNGFL